MTINLFLLATSGFPTWSVILFIAGIAFVIFSIIYGATHPNPASPVFWGRTDLGMVLIVVAIALKVIFEI